MTVYVEMKISVAIDGVIDEERVERLSEDQQEMLEMIAGDALPQSVQVYYNGDDNPPAECFIEIHDIEEVEIY